MSKMRLSFELSLDQINIMLAEAAANLPLSDSGGKAQFKCRTFEHDPKLGLSIQEVDAHGEVLCANGMRSYNYTTHINKSIKALSDWWRHELCKSYRARYEAQIIAAHITPAPSQKKATL